MTTDSRQSYRTRSVLVFLAALVTVLFTVLAAGTASAATGVAAQNRVGASAVAVAPLVGPTGDVYAGQRWGHAPPQTKTTVATGVAAKSGDEFVNLASDARTTHILDGEVRPNGSLGGGHRPGTGFPNKSEFPAGWSDEKIMHSISDVATDPSLAWRAGNVPGDFFVNGTRGGADIEVLIRKNQIWTGYPTNVIRNAP